jgi:hypothetical protein
MSMNVDHYFAIGRRHVTAGEPCQDYALSAAVADGRVYGVVADGCSGANAHTDIGARALAHAFAAGIARVSPVETGAMPARPFDDRFLAALGQRFRDNWFTENPDDYLATVVGFLADAKRASVFMFGDGAVMLRYRDGRYRLLTVDWAGNMPYYLAYTFSTSAQAAFRAACPLHPNRVSVTDRVFVLVDGKPQVLSLDVRWMGQESFEKGWAMDFDLATEGIQAVAVATDGLTDLGGKDWPEGEAGWMLTVAELLGFKNHEGAFVKRRAIRALEGYARRGVAPRDDLALAVVWAESETNPGASGEGA